MWSNWENKDTLNKIKKMTDLGRDNSYSNIHTFLS